MCVSSWHLSRLQTYWYNWVHWLGSTFHIRCAQLFHLSLVGGSSTILLDMCYVWDKSTRLLCPGSQTSQHYHSLHI